MSESNNNNEPTTVDELHDRLMDRVLTEVVGGESPPDLSERITTAAVNLRAGDEDSAISKSRSGRFSWIHFVVAASLLVGLSLLVLSATRNARETTGSVAKLRLDNSLSQVQSKTAIRTSAANDGNQGPVSADGDFDELVDLIESTVTVEAWTDKGKRVRPFPTNLDIVISQSQSLHEESVITRPEGEIANRVAEVETAPAPTRESGSTEYHILRGPSDRAAISPGLPTSESELLAQSAEAGANSRNYNLIKAFGAPGTKKPQSGERQLLAREYRLHDRETLFAATPSAPADGRESAYVLSTINGRVVVKLEVASGLQPADGENRAETDLGTGPGLSGDQYTRIVENPFIEATGLDAVSTFSIDVDTASYANVRQFLMEMNQLPPADAVRIEELVNYFPYDYAGPNSEEDETPFAAHVEVAGCPWKPEHRLVRIGVKGRQIDRDQRPTSNLVFLVDVSGSMNQPSKLPLVVHGLERLARELGENDRVAIVVYASKEGLVLPSTPGSEQRAILASLGQLSAGGSTAGGAGIRLAYQIAEDHFVTGGTNRVILCTDGDFNVGVTSTAELERLVEEKAKQTGVFLSVLGFGRGNLNDAMMEAISGRGNGNYYYVDNRREARKVLVEEMTGTLVTIAKDVKIQVEFNPAQVAGYRLLGYENRMLRTEDFNDDTKDAGEIGAGHAVTALYEVIPAGQPVDLPPVDELKYQRPAETAGRLRLSNEDADTADADISRELLTLKMKYKQPDADKSEDTLTWPVTDTGKSFSAATTDFQFASAVAGFGLLLRDSKYKAGATWDAVFEIAESSRGSDEHGYRTEFLELVRRAKALQRGQQ